MHGFDLAGGREPDIDLRRFGDDIFKGQRAKLRGHSDDEFPVRLGILHDKGADWLVRHHNLYRAAGTLYGVEAVENLAVCFRCALERPALLLRVQLAADGFQINGQQAVIGQAFQIGAGNRAVKQTLGLSLGGGGNADAEGFVNPLYKIVGLLMGKLPHDFCPAMGIGRVGDEKVYDFAVGNALYGDVIMVDGAHSRFPSSSLFR